MTLTVGPTEDIAACVALRRAVFIEEQSVPEDVEQDGRDGEAHHVLAVLDGVPVGCGRILVDGATGKIGRVCVLREHRGQGIGLALVGACLEVLRGVPGVTRAELGAQSYAIGLYERLGFTAYGPEFADAGGQPHRMMGRSL
ncbi:GNAT family N-acetyltransferase [Roseovarius sp.]|uniref:GNAT family N-acetyltransferase n=1 Tax=Roseovarius sp. TaxID=1486281 RepID=UPI003BA8A0C8